MPLAAAFGLGSNLLLLAVHRWWPRIFIDRADVALFKLTSQVIVMYAFICIEDCLSFNLGGESGVAAERGETGARAFLLRDRDREKG